MDITTETVQIATSVRNDGGAWECIDLATFSAQDWADADPRDCGAEEWQDVQLELIVDDVVVDTKSTDGADEALEAAWSGANDRAIETARELAREYGAVANPREVGTYILTVGSRRIAFGPTDSREGGPEAWIDGTIYHLVGEDWDPVCSTGGSVDQKNGLVGLGMDLARLAGDK